MSRRTPERLTATGRRAGAVEVGVRYPQAATAPQPMTARRGETAIGTANRVLKAKPGSIPARRPRRYFPAEPVSPWRKRRRGSPWWFPPAGAVGRSKERSLPVRLRPPPPFSRLRPAAGFADGEAGVFHLLSPGAGRFPGEAGTHGDPADRPGGRRHRVRGRCRPGRDRKSGRGPARRRPGVRARPPAPPGSRS